MALTYAGASTISQQVAKNIFLWPGGGFVRKGIEAWLTFLIELVWDKQRILEVYLNIAQFSESHLWRRSHQPIFFPGLCPVTLPPKKPPLLAAVLPGPELYRLEESFLGSPR